MARYANVIVDISVEKLDKTFQYRIPEQLVEEIHVGSRVVIPFGPRKLTGYVIALTDEAEFDETKIKPIESPAHGMIAVEEKLIALAAWMRQNYGSTMNQALKVVLPVKQQTKQVVHKTICLLLGKEEAKRQLALYESKKNVARARLLRELITCGSLDSQVVTGKLHVSLATVRAMEEQKIVSIHTTTSYRNPIANVAQEEYRLTLSQSQQSVVDTIEQEKDRKEYEAFLIKGVTGSGKTEVYMELIAHTIEQGKQAIVLIPEISLTYQTVKRFYQRFGNRVSILNSKLSDGEKYDQYMRAKNGDIDILIGPRSALFAPFEKLGLIIIDEEHEGSYKSEMSPRYHAREVAIYRAKQYGATVILGSATPSIESYYQTEIGRYRLLELKERIMNRPLPECEIIDLREELRMGNRSILSARLQELMEERLSKKQQIMLFINRRGVSGIVSCRACGEVIKCPHCDVSLSLHNNGKMLCHYCGFEQEAPKLCPSCGSKYISGFKAGTQKIEQMVQKRFPSARILRMDYDTTRQKNSYETILQAFGNGEADILIGTQMIVKGHDFANVTLMGILAADMSLHVADFHAAERTFQLLTQAAGRTGRGHTPGNVVIQSYDPEHYAITTAKDQDYEAFYQRELGYRQLLRYPPIWNMLVIMCSSSNQEQLEMIAQRIKELIETKIDNPRRIQLVGPADASIQKVADIYRKVLYLKTSDYLKLVEIKDLVEEGLEELVSTKEVSVLFDFNPMSGF